MAEYLFNRARLIDPVKGTDRMGDLAVSGAFITGKSELKNPEVIDLNGKVLCRGFIDLHVHLRQPGNTGAETIATGTRAAAAGGFTSIVAMPNTSPAADNAGAIEYLRQTAARQGVVKVLPCGCMTKNYAGAEMTGIGGLKKAGVVAISDDGRCVQDHALMRHIMEYATSFGLPILDHCEENTLAAGGVMNEGKWSVLLGIRGIPGEAEELMVARDIMLLRRIRGGRVHIQHVSTAGSVELIRRARAKGLLVSGEITPHHLALTDENIKKYDTNYKMNPPLRSEEDRAALIEALKDGTITVIATDHAPHTETSKRVEFDEAPFGIVGLETAFAVSHTVLCVENKLPLPELISKFTAGPAEVLGMENYSLDAGNPADLTVLDPEMKYTIDKEKFFSKGRNTPFHGFNSVGAVLMTMVDGRKVYVNDDGA